MCPGITEPRAARVGGTEAQPEVVRVYDISPSELLAEPHFRHFLGRDREALEQVMRGDINFQREEFLKDFLLRSDLVVNGAKVVNTGVEVDVPEGRQEVFNRFCRDHKVDDRLRNLIYALAWQRSVASYTNFVDGLSQYCLAGYQEEHLYKYMVSRNDSPDRLTYSFDTLDDDRVKLVVYSPIHSLEAFDPNTDEHKGAIKNSDGSDIGFLRVTYVIDANTGNMSVNYALVTRNEDFDRIISIKSEVLSHEHKVCVLMSRGGSEEEEAEQVRLKGAIERLMPNLKSRTSYAEQLAESIRSAALRRKGLRWTHLPGTKRAVEALIAEIATAARDPKIGLHEFFLKCYVAINFDAAIPDEARDDLLREVRQLCRERGGEIKRVADGYFQVEGADGAVLATEEHKIGIAVNVDLLIQDRDGNTFVDLLRDFLDADGYGFDITREAGADGELAQVTYRGVDVDITGNKITFNNVDERFNEDQTQAIRAVVKNLLKRDSYAILKPIGNEQQRAAMYDIIKEERTALRPPSPPPTPNAVAPPYAGA